MKHKRKFEMIKTHYNKIPDKINKVDLSIQAYGLFHYLLSLPEEVNPGKATIAKNFNSTRQTVAKWYAELVMAGIIKIYVKGGLNRTTKYEFCHMDSWIVK